MSEPNNSGATRRDFLKLSGSLAAASALAGVAVPRVHAAENNTIQVALIGCGGRGTGAAADALSSTGGPMKLVAMADIFNEKLKPSYENLKKEHGDKIDVPDDRKFIGFDGYQKAMDCLKPGDIAIFASPLAFRWVHFGYAIQKGLNVFMEKPLTSDGPTSLRMLEMGKEASKKNLKVAVGLMSRHARHLQQLQKRVQDGEIGDLIAMRAYRMHGPLGSAYSEKWPGSPSELLWQLQRFHSFLWASGGCFSDFYIHVVDHCCWMKNDWPVKAQGLGGRHYRLGPSGQPCIDQNFDTYTVEYTFKDGTKLFLDGRNMAGAEQIYSSYLHGSKGLAVASRSGDCGAPSSIHKNQIAEKSSMIWQSEVAPEERNPYQNEWNDLMAAIRNDKPYSEVEHGVMGSAVTSLGRMAAHTGVEVTLEQFLNSGNEYAPGLDKLTMDSPAPLPADAEGKYPIPQPGLVTNREY